MARGYDAQVRGKDAPACRVRMRHRAAFQRRLMRRFFTTATQRLLRIFDVTRGDAYMRLLQLDFAIYACCLSFTSCRHIAYHAISQQRDAITRRKDRGTPAKMPRDAWRA